MDLQNIIENDFEQRGDITPANAGKELREAIEETLQQLESGTLRVAQPGAAGWHVNEWVKKAVLLSFRIQGDRRLLRANRQKRAFKRRRRHRRRTRALTSQSYHY